MISIQPLTPHFELKLKSGNLSGHFSHKVNAAAQLTASEQSCSTSSSTLNVCCHIVKRVCYFAGLDLVLAGPSCCTQLPLILVDWTCQVENGKANHLQRISQLTALISLAIEDKDDTVASLCALQQLRKLRNLRINRYDALTFAETPFINLVELDLVGGANQVCNLESCVQLSATRLALYGVGVGLTQLTLPRGPSVQLRDIFLANSSHAPGGDFHVDNLHFASQLTRLHLEIVYPKWDMGWPRFLPDLSELEVEETSAKVCHFIAS